MGWWYKHNNAQGHAGILTFLSLTACVMLVRVCPRGIIETLCSLKCSLSNPATVWGSTISDRFTSNPGVINNDVTTEKSVTMDHCCAAVLVFIFGDEEWVF